MKILYKICSVIILVAYLCCSCESGKAKYEKAIRQKMVDPDATLETVALFDNLMKLSENHIIFGHQAATEYGRNWQNEDNRSDVKDATGSHPGVIGHDFSGFTRPEQSVESIEREQQRLAKLIASTYDRGGVITICWHSPNPVTGGNYAASESSGRPVGNIIPGGSHHEKYKEILTRIANFANNVKGSDGKLVPMIFRPYHEFDGSWFWWGARHCTREEFIELWRFTVTYLRDELKVRNFIYAFSPDCLYNSEEDFLKRYPGDEYVDMVGVDNYADFGRDGPGRLEAGIKKLKIVSDYALKNQKLAAFTETGLEAIPDTTWWTKTLLYALKEHDVKMCYALVWRNAYRGGKHYYATTLDHPSYDNFMEFYNDPFTLFENDLSDMYVLKPWQINK